MVKRLSENLAAPLPIEPTRNPQGRKKGEMSQISPSYASLAGDRLKPEKFQDEKAKILTRAIAKWCLSPSIRGLFTLLAISEIACAQSTKSTANAKSYKFRNILSKHPQIIDQFIKIRKAQEGWEEWLYDLLKITYVGDLAEKEKCDLKMIDGLVSYMKRPARCKKINEGIRRRISEVGNGEFRVDRRRVTTEEESDDVGEVGNMDFFRGENLIDDDFHMDIEDHRSLQREREQPPFNYSQCDSELEDVLHRID